MSQISNRKLIYGCIAGLLVFLVIIGSVLFTQKPKESIDEPQEPIQQEEVKTPVFDRLIRLTDADSGFILNKDEPSFIFVGHFETNESDKALKEIYEKLNEEFGYSNLAYVIDLDESTLEISDDSVIFGTETLKAKGHIALIFEGEVAATFDMKDQTIESTRAFFNQFYVGESASEENN